MSGTIRVLIRLLAVVENMQLPLEHPLLRPSASPIYCKIDTLAALLTVFSQLVISFNSLDDNDHDDLNVLYDFFSNTAPNVDAESKLRILKSSTDDSLNWRALQVRTRREFPRFILVLSQYLFASVRSHSLVPYIRMALARRHGHILGWPPK